MERVIAMFEDLGDPLAHPDECSRHVHCIGLMRAIVEFTKAMQRVSAYKTQDGAISLWAQNVLVALAFVRPHAQDVSATCQGLFDANCLGTSK
jgi:hypothetical protein